MPSSSESLGQEDDNGITMSYQSQQQQQQQQQQSSTSQQQQQHYHSSSSEDESPSPPPLQHAFFAPPFYNRPPTPLPPSPSLTSLLRPSRPTTPDSSDHEFPSSHTQPVPRASPKVPTYEYYGFVLYLFSSLTFAIYLLWSYLPKPFLHAWGITYYPNRWWSLAIPSWLVMLLVWIYVGLAGYNTGYLTLGLQSVETIVDDAANIATIERMTGGSITASGGIASVGKGKPRTLERTNSGLANGEIKDWKAIWSIGTDAVMDVPLGGVCEVLYGEGRDFETDDDEEP